MRIDCEIKARVVGTALAWAGPEAQADALEAWAAIRLGAGCTWNAELLAVELRHRAKTDSVRLFLEEVLRCLQT